MKCDFDLELFGGEAAVGEGVLFVDEFHGDDGVVGMEGGRFADAVIEESLVTWVHARGVGRTMRMRPCRWFC